MCTHILVPDNNININEGGESSCESLMHSTLGNRSEQGCAGKGLPSALAERELGQSSALFVFTWIWVIKTQKSGEKRDLIYCCSGYRFSKVSRLKLSLNFCSI